MIHEVSSGSKGQATDIEIATNHIIKLRNKLNRLLAKNTNQPLKKINKDTKRDYYMNAEEALNYRIIDKIIE